MKRKDANAWQNQIQVDFSADTSSFQQELRERLMLTLASQAVDHKNTEEVEPVKKTLRYSARSILIAVLAIVIVSASALAVANSLKLGPFATYELDENAMTREAYNARLNGYRADWEGKIFDSQGQPIDDLTKHEAGADPTMYNATGEMVDMGIEDGKLVIAALGELPESPMLKLDTLEAVQPYLYFEAQVPSYVPDGYALDHFEIYGEAGDAPKADSKYLTIVYSKPGVKGSEMTIMVRFMDEETAFDTSTSREVRSMKVAGVDAVIEGHSLDILFGDVLYTFMPMHSGIPLDDLIKMAQSMAK